MRVRRRGDVCATYRDRDPTPDSTSRLLVQGHLHAHGTDKVNLTSGANPEPPEHLGLSGDAEPEHLASGWARRDPQPGTVGAERDAADIAANILVEQERWRAGLWVAARPPAGKVFRFSVAAKP
jgi:hypothetical protein